MSTITRVAERVTALQIARHCGWKLKPERGGYVTCCPIHGENTPSFHIHTSGERVGQCKCFGCGFWAGDSVALWAKLRGLAMYPAALELAQAFGLDLSEPVALPPVVVAVKEKAPDPVAAIEPERRAKLLADFLFLCKAATPEDARLAAWDYLRGRGFTADTIRRAGIVAGSREAIGALRAMGYSAAELRAAGLLIAQDKKPDYYAFSGQSLIIPYYQGGQIVTLQGRVVPGADRENSSKYLNLRGPRGVWGLDALTGAKAGQDVYLCEGVLDALTLVQAGGLALAFPGANGALELLQPHFPALRGRRVVVALDADPSGESAASALLEALRAAGFTAERGRPAHGAKDVNAAAQLTRADRIKAGAEGAQLAALAALNPQIFNLIENFNLRVV